MFFYVREVLLPSENIEAVKKGIVGVGVTDLYPRWLGTKELFFSHRDPYGVQVSREIQTAYYGHPLRPEEHRDEQRFAYPLYVVFLLWPTMWSSFETAQAVAVVALGLATAVSVWCWLCAIGWKAKSADAAAIILLTLSSPFVVQGLRLQQLGLLAAAFLAAAVALTVRGSLMAAGAMLALSTIKPQMAALPCAWFFLWSASDLRKRRNLPIGFLTAMALLVGSAEAVSPGWLSHFYDGIVAYGHYANNSNVMMMMFGRIPGLIFSTAVLLSALAACWRARGTEANTADFSLALGFLLVTETLVQPTLVTPFSFVLIVPSILMVVQQWERLWEGSLVTKALLAALALVMAWPPVAAFVMLVIHFQHPGQLIVMNVPAAMSFFVPPLLFFLFVTMAASQRSASQVRG